MILRVIRIHWSHSCENYIIRKEQKWFFNTFIQDTPQNNTVKWDICPQRRNTISLIRFRFHRNRFYIKYTQFLNNNLIDLDIHHLLLLMFINVVNVTLLSSICHFTDLLLILLLIDPLVASIDFDLLIFKLSAIF